MSQPTTMWKINNLEVPTLSQDLAKDNWWNIHYRSQPLWHIFREEAMFDELAIFDSKLDCSEMYMSSVGYNIDSDRFQVSFTDSSNQNQNNIVIEFRVIESDDDDDHNIEDVTEVKEFNCNVTLLRLPPPDEDD